jgi:protein-tyrosine-phosphatase
MAEAMLNHLGNGRFCAMSAGDQAVGQIHPMALAILCEHGVPTRPFGRPPIPRSAAAMMSKCALPSRRFTCP